MEIGEKTMGTYKRVFGAIMAKHDARTFQDTLPELQDDEILLKMEACNICTTDYQQWMGLRDHQGFPMAQGHEYVGIIIEKGKNVEPYLEIGDRVGHATETCGVCPDCKAGRTSDCLYKPKTYSVKGPDGFIGCKAFANYMIIKSRMAIKMSKDLTPGEACFLEPVATVVKGMRKTGVGPEDTVAVVGLGTMGSLNAQVAHALGAKVIMLDISEKKIARAKELGIGPVINSLETDPVAAVKELTNGKGVDVVVPAVGNSKAYEQAMAMLKKDSGRFLVFAAGYPKPELVIDPNTIHYRKLSIIGTGGADLRDFQMSAELINTGRVRPIFSLEGKVIGLKDFNDAMIAAATPDAYRVTVDLQDCGL